MIYKTSDIGLGAFLLSKKIKIISLEKDKRDSRKMFFVFDNTDQKAEKTAIDFINSVEKKYDSNLRLLKLMVKEEMRR